MWRQLIAGFAGLSLSWTPVVGAGGIQIAQPSSVPVETVAVHQRLDSDVRYGKEAIALALEGLIRILTDEYYKQYGGLFVTRRMVERRIRSEVNKRKEQMFHLVEKKYMCDGVPVQFNPKTDLIIYSKNHCLRTASLKEIAALVMELGKKLHQDS